MSDLDFLEDKIPKVEELINLIKYEFEEGGFKKTNSIIARNAIEIRKFKVDEYVLFKNEISGFHSIKDSELNAFRKKVAVQVKTGWENEMDSDQYGKFRGSLKNCNIILKSHEFLIDCIKWNSFLQRPVLTKNVPFLHDIHLKDGQWIEVDGEVMPQLRSWLSMEYAEFGKEVLDDALTNVALKNKFNPLTYLLDKCHDEWDGEKRLDSWLFDLCDADKETQNEKYVSVVGVKWMVSAVARAYDHGCKVDTMLIFEGGQGYGKSSFLRELSFGYFLELLSDISRGKDVIDKLLGKWIVEMPELKALSGDREANKAFLTQQIDTERLSYNRRSQPYPRRCVFIGTTNEEFYLKDETGERRYWPVKVGKCDIEKLKLCLRNLWGEAVHRYRNGEKWWMDSEVLNKLCSDAQGLKYDADEMTSSVEDFLIKSNGESFNMIALWTSVFGGSKENFSKATQMRIAKILNSLKAHKNSKDKTWSRK